jgi:hypothetical protein
LRSSIELLIHCGDIHCGDLLGLGGDDVEK